MVARKGGFGYHISVEEEFKSPLPPRRIAVGEETRNEENNQEEEKIVSQPAAGSRGEIPGTEGAAKAANPLLKNKKSLMIFGLIALAIIVIAGLVFKVILPMISKPGGGETTLIYWGLWENDSIVNGLLADFEEKNPGIKVKYVYNSKIDYRSRLVGRMAKDPSQEEIPDVFRYHSSWIPMLRNNLAAVPPATAANIGLDSDFFEVYKEDLKKGNSYVGVPLMYDGLALFYNKDLIESAQVDLPKSWWDLQTAAKSLTVKDNQGKIQVAGVAMGLVDNVDHWSDILGLIMKQNGVDLLEGSAENETKLKNILNFYTLFSTKDKVWDPSLPRSTDMFVSGKLGFYFAPSWRVFNIEEMKPSQNPKLRYEIAPVPQLPILTEGEQAGTETKLTNINWASYWVEGVNQKSPHQKEAWKLLEFLSSKDSLEKLYLTASQTRHFGEIYPRKSMSSMLTDNSKVTPFVSAANTASSGYLSSRTFDSGLNDEMSKYFGDAINTLVNSSAAESEAMTALRNGIQQLVQKYQLNK
jgi:ABC-type glycerol-3-phosphate transport system substrate-binding protein